MQYPEDFINQIFNEDCLLTMSKIPDNSLDMCISSPPYDSARTYNGYNFEFEKIAKELYRILKSGRILVWIVADQTKDFCESLTSFKQAIYFVEECGFKLLDTMIYTKKNVPPTYPNMKRYIPATEYMFILSKNKPEVFNPIIDRPNLYAGIQKTGDTQRQKDGTTKSVRGYIPKQFGMRFNVWQYDTGKNKDTKDISAFKHPGRFPEKLVEDHILSWSNEGDIIYDPMMGSGTTAKMALLNKRRFIGSEISKEYCDIINERLKNGSVVK